MNEAKNDADRIAEQAYRRGVHQALGALAQYLEKDEARSISDPELIIDMFVSNASKMRRETKHHDWYTHELVNRVRDEVVSYKKAYRIP